MKVLVTGASGFLGRHVVAELLRRGHRVRAMTRPDTNIDAIEWKARADVEIVRCDLRRHAGLSTSVAGVDAAVHCAASMGGGMAEQMAGNVEATEHLLDAMEQAHVERIVGISTFALYDYAGAPEGTVIDEDSPLERDFDARDPYTRTKRLQEDLIKLRASNNGWKWTIIRPGVIYGPGRTWFYHLGFQLGATRWVRYGGDSIFPITYVENCAEAIALALERPEADGQVIDVVDDDLPTRARYMEELVRRTDAKPRVLPVPWAVIGRAAGTAWAVNRTLFKGRAPLPAILRPPAVGARCKPLRYSNRRAKEVLGWTPRYTLSEALDRSTSAAA